MGTVELLPRKAFEIKLSDGKVIEGQFSLWSVKRFCDKQKLTLAQLGERLTAEKTTFDDVCQIVLCAVEYTSRKKEKPFSYTDLHACEWIEDLGGLTSDNYASLMAHAASGEVEEEKKSPLTS